MLDAKGLVAGVNRRYQDFKLEGYKPELGDIVKYINTSFFFKHDISVMASYAPVNESESLYPKDRFLFPFFSIACSEESYINFIFLSSFSDIFYVGCSDRYVNINDGYASHEEPVFEVILRGPECEYFSYDGSLVSEKALEKEKGSFHMSSSESLASEVFRGLLGAMLNVKITGYVGNPNFDYHDLLEEIGIYMYNPDSSGGYSIPLSSMSPSSWASLYFLLALPSLGVLTKVPYCFTKGIKSYDLSVLREEDGVFLYVYAS